MKKFKTGFGLFALAGAFLLALGTSQNANALKYYRWAPGQIVVNPSSDCNKEFDEPCAAIYSDNDEPLGIIETGRYLGN